MPKKPYSISLSLADKIDTLVGFFGINQKPTSSKDPFALRRVALGIIRTIIENKINLKVSDLLSYSSSLYQDQGYKFINQDIQKELYNFLKDRFRYYMKQKQSPFFATVSSYLIYFKVYSLSISNATKEKTQYSLLLVIIFWTSLKKRTKLLLD